MITIHNPAFFISIIIWLLITIAFTIPTYKEHGKMDLGGLLVTLILLTSVGFMVTCLLMEGIIRLIKLAF